ncbi:BRISC and BRCA1-A complex member 2-like [Osmia bicornis bicornis]|uniref:BRISC and BRCA1-A complex member 2-like n=1 Tax=Osmia bicornis bicornis TaxID=1437191 RepID=UPI0010F78DDB|nr:BRISC and BRCA1-A complex member 2-like [Osmia bicornis bicornis]
MLSQQYPILTHVESHIKPLLMDVLSTDKIGVCHGSVELHSVSSSCGKVEGDRFRLLIPYARQNLAWNVFFDSQYPEMGPDFIFNDNSFLVDTDINTLSVKVPSLTEWNPNDKHALLNVLIELLSCYKQHQMQLLQKQDKLQLECNMLMTSTEVKPEDVEMILLPFGSKPTEARFVISLSVDVSQLEARTYKSESDAAMLLIIFSGTDWNRIIAHIFFSKSLEEALGGPRALNLPPLPPNKFLIDYIPEVKKCITDKINSINQSLIKRREYISAILAVQFPSVQEWDSVKYSYITMVLSDQEDFHVMVKIELPAGFPNEKPIILLNSLYHMEGPHSAYSEVFEDFPYKVNWDSFFKVKKLLLCIKHAIKSFKQNTVKNYCS